MIPREVEQLEKVFGQFMAKFAKNLSEEKAIGDLF